MSDQWPPPAPNVNKAFKKAQNATNDNTVKPPPLPIVTKKEIEALEAQRSKPAPQLNLNPPGMAQSTTAMDKVREERLKKMKERMQLPKERLEKNFERNR